MIRILLADDHAAVRSGLAEFFANFNDISIVAAVPDGETAVSAAANCDTDVVLMDINMPGIGGVEAVRQIMAACPQTRVLMFSAFSDQGHVQDALAAGAVGFIAKGGDPRELIRQIRETAAAS
jgi:DNA-binding NarL/FixJ family response regulator